MGVSDPNTREETLLDQRRLVDVLIELQVALRKLSLYSISHTTAPGIISHLTKQFGQLLESVDHIPLGIGKEEILFHGSPIGKNNATIRELARTFHLFNLVGVTFYRGLDQAQIEKFVGMVTEGRTLTLPEKEQLISLSQEHLPAIFLQLISFREAEGPSDRGISPGGSGAEQDGEEREFWQVLVRCLTEENLPEEVKSLLSNEAAAPVINPQKIADAINQLINDADDASENYEKVIADFLRDQVGGRTQSRRRYAIVNQQLEKLLVDLRPEIREGIFRNFMEDTRDQKTTLEDLLDVMPPPLMLEVLNQIQVKGAALSSPMLGLLKKLGNLSRSNVRLKEMMESKFRDRKDLFNELFVDRADREYYPAEYRTTLDKDLLSEPEAPPEPPRVGFKEPEGWETRQQLALAILELLEHPIGMESQYETCVDTLVRMLQEGFGGESRAVLLKAVKILMKRHEAETERAEFIRKQIHKFFKPEMLSLLLQTPDTPSAEEEEGVLDFMMKEAAGDLIPVLLDILEVEEKISARKRIMSLIEKSGGKASPLVARRLDSDKWYVVRNMLVLLGQLRAREAVSQIAACLRHPNEKVRLAVLQALGSVGSDRETLEKTLALALKDGDPKVYRTGILMLLSIRSQQAMNLILPLLDPAAQGKGSTDRQSMTLKCIGESGNREWIEPLSRIRQGLVLKFWTWGRYRVLMKEIGQAIARIDSRVPAGRNKRADRS